MKGAKKKRAPVRELLLKKLNFFAYYFISVTEEHLSKPFRNTRNPRAHNLSVVTHFLEHSNFKYYLLRTYLKSIRRMRHAIISVVTMEARVWYIK
jgi:hypothetical protein